MKAWMLLKLGIVTGHRCSRCEAHVSKCIEFVQHSCQHASLVNLAVKDCVT
jgi:hypothetical protein